MKLFFTTIITIFTFLAVANVQAQDTLTRAVWLDRVMEFGYAEANLTLDEAQWVRKMLDRTCDCKAIEDELKNNDCIAELMREENFPDLDVDLEDITPEQMRKFNLLSPLMTSVIGGKCPDK